MASVTNEGLAIEIKNLSVQIADLKASISASAASYVTKDVHDLQLKEIDMRIDIVKAELRQLMRSKWIQNTLSAVLGATLTVLIAHFITTLGR